MDEIDSKTVIYVLNLLRQLELIVLLCGLGIGTAVYKRLNFLHKTVYVYISVMTLLVICLKISKYIIGTTVMLLPVYCLLDMLLITYLYNFCMLKKKNKYLLLLGATTIIYIVYEWVWIFLINEIDYKTFQPYMKIFVNFTVIIYSLYFIYERVNNYSETKWQGYKLNYAFLIFYTLTTFFFLPYNLWVNGNLILIYTSTTIHALLVPAFYGFLTVQIWKNANTYKIQSK